MLRGVHLLSSHLIFICTEVVLLLLLLLFCWVNVGDRTLELKVYNKTRCHQATRPNGVEVVILVIRDVKYKILPTHFIQPSNSCPVWAIFTLKEDMTLLRAFSSKISKNLAFNISKTYFIYFNNSFDNSSNIKSFIFFTISLKYYYFFILNLISSTTHNHSHQHHHHPTPNHQNHKQKQTIVNPQSPPANPTHNKPNPANPPSPTHLPPP